MFYISRTQFESIKKKFEVKQVLKNSNSFVFNLYEKYNNDYLYQVAQNNNIISYVMVFEIENVPIYTMIMSNENHDVFMNVFFRSRCLILNKLELKNIFQYGFNEIQSIRDHCYKIEKECIERMAFSTRISCSEMFTLDVFSEQEVPYCLIREYILFDSNDSASSCYKIHSCDNEIVYCHIQSLFNTIQHFYQLRIVNKPKIKAEGNGYVFFELKEHIIGFQKYYNVLESPCTYYLINKSNGAIFVFALTNSIRQSLRIGQAIFSYNNVKFGGINLHASAAVYNNKAILFTGDKRAGKTTTLLFGLKDIENLKIMSNDSVHLFCKDEKIYAYGSPKKMTIRYSTVELFDELLKIQQSEYDSVGNNQAENINLVKSISDIARAFSRKVQYCAPVKLIVFIRFNPESKEDVIEEVGYNEAIDIFSKQKHSFYNGREKFWNEIFKCEQQLDFSLIKDAKFLQIDVSENNIHKIWKKIIDFSSY